MDNKFNFSENVLNQNDESGKKAIHKKTIRNILISILIVLVIIGSALGIVANNISSRLQTVVDVDYSISNIDQETLFRDSLVKLITNGEVLLTDEELSALIPVIQSYMKENEADLKLLKCKVELKDTNKIYFLVEKDNKTYSGIVDIELSFTKNKVLEVTLNSLQIGEYTFSDYILKNLILPSWKLNDEIYTIEGNKILIDLKEYSNNIKSDLSININDFSIENQKFKFAMDNPFEELLEQLSSMTKLPKEKIVEAIITEYLKDGEVTIMDLIKYLF